MKHGRTDRDWAVVALMTFGAGSLITWALSGQQAAIPRLTVEQWAAWVQAIGSLIAIGVAIMVPWRQRKQQIEDARAKDDRERAREEQLIRVMHGALFQPIEQFRGHCEMIFRFLHHSAEVRRALPGDVFDRAPEFDQFRSSLHLMGNTGVDVNVLIARQDHLRMMLRAMREHPTLDGPFLEKASRDIEKSRELAVRILPVLRHRGLQKSNEGHD